jgi:hypothetical protein
MSDFPLLATVQISGAGTPRYRGGVRARFFAKDNPAIFLHHGTAPTDMHVQLEVSYLPDGEDGRYGVFLASIHFK